MKVLLATAALLLVAGCGGTTGTSADTDPYVGNGTTSCLNDSQYRSINVGMTHAEVVKLVAPVVASDVDEGGDPGIVQQYDWCENSGIVWLTYDGTTTPGTLVKKSREAPPQ